MIMNPVVNEVSAQLSDLFFTILPVGLFFVCFFLGLRFINFLLFAFTSDSYTPKISSNDEEKTVDECEHTTADIYSVKSDKDIVRTEKDWERELKRLEKEKHL